MSWLVRGIWRARARLNGTGPTRGDGGFMLVYVLLVTSVITIAATSSLIVTTADIVPGRQSEDAAAAEQAAEAGLQDALAYLNATCPSTGARCDTAIGHTATNTRTGSNVLSGGETFSWTIPGYVTATNNSYSAIRVDATGTSNGISRSLVGDIEGINGVLNYEYYTTYETLGANTINADYPNRSIALTTAGDCSAITVASVSCSSSSPATATWNGASGSSPSDSVCNTLWYNSASLDGSSGVGRATSEAGLPTGEDWAEQGSIGGTSVTRYAPCQEAFATGDSFDGPVYTVDAPLVSDVTSGCAGPTFNSTFQSAWSSVNTPAAPNSPYRADPYAGGSLTNPPTTASNTQTFSSTFYPAVAASACVYFGPTRISLNGDGTATVTSPLSNSSIATSSLSTDSGCYPSEPLPSGGIVDFTFNYSSHGGGVIYVKNDNKPANGFTTTSQKSTSTATGATSSTSGNTVFYLSSSTGGASNPNTAPSAVAGNTCSSPANLYSTAANANCGWSNLATTTDGGTGWTALSSSSCSTLHSSTSSATATDEQNFNCELNNDQTTGTPPAGAYSAAIGRIKTDLAASSYTISGNGSCSSATFAPSSATAAQLACLVQHELHAGNTGAKEANYASPALNDHQYVVSQVGSSTTTTSTSSLGSVPSAAVPGDSLFTTPGGTAAKETDTATTSTFAVSRQTYNCSLLNLLGVCIGTESWGSTTAQFDVTVTQNSYTFTPGQTVSYFPSMSDVTQYAIGTTSANGPGDAYVQGSNNGKLSVLADNDVMATGNLTDANTSSAMDLDALGNVRVYNPVQCVDTTAADINSTTPGFCPNDITGLYSGGLTNSNGTLQSDHPAAQYTNMLGTPVTEIDAACVAQGGSFLTQNFDRGSSLGTLTVKGGLYQVHRGSLGVQWEVQSSYASRAQSGYKLKMNYVNLQTAVPYVPAFQGGSTTRYWNLVAVSTPG